MASWGNLILHAPQKLKPWTSKMVAKYFSDFAHLDLDNIAMGIQCIQYIAMDCLLGQPYTTYTTEAQIHQRQSLEMVANISLTRGAGKEFEATKQVLEAESVCVLNV